MTQQEYNLSILEMDNQLVQRCEPIRKEIDEVGNRLDNLRIEHARLSLELDTAKERVQDAQMTLTCINSKYEKLKEDRRQEMKTNGASKYETEQVEKVFNDACFNERREAMVFLTDATTSREKARRMYGLNNVAIKETLCKFNQLQARLKNIQREEWNRKHDFIVRNQAYIEQ